jgi:hypothetical protein
MNLTSLNPKELTALEFMRSTFNGMSHFDKNIPDSWFQLDDWTYLRYLKARQFNTHKAERMLRETIKFREENKCALLTEENASDYGKEIINNKYWLNLGYSKNGSPIQMAPIDNFDPSIVTNEEEVSIAFIRAMENIGRSMVRNKFISRQMILIYDMEKYSIRKQASLKGMRISLKMTSINEAHYPEFMYKVIVFKAPVVFNGVWLVFKGLINEETSSKVIFSSDNATLKQYIDDSLLETRHGGTLNIYPQFFWKEIK